MGVRKLRGGTWNSERVVEIIKNEKYVGNDLLQKKYVKDHLTKNLVLTVTRSVKVIAATAGLSAPVTTGTPSMKRVAAYARVSTDNEEQLSEWNI